MKLLRYLIITTITGLGITALGANTSVTTSLESSVAQMGSYVKLRVQAVEPVDSNTELIRLSYIWPAEVELRPDSVTTVKSLGNGLQEITRDYILQSFDSGLYTLPPFVHIVGTDTTMSAPISLKINPIDVSQLEDIHPLAAPVSPGSKWYDFLPDWLTDNWKLITALILLLAAGIIAVLIFTKRIKVPFLPEKKLEPPYDQAKRLLAILKNERLWEKGRDKEYYSGLTDILRRYIGRRYNVNALEMTSSQLLAYLSGKPEIATELPNVKAVLYTADFVKFAKMQPRPEVNIKAYDATDEFIEHTRPTEPIEPAENVTKAGTKPKRQSNKPNKLRKNK